MTAKLFNKFVRGVNKGLSIKEICEKLGFYRLIVYQKYKFKTKFEKCYRDVDKVLTEKQIKKLQQLRIEYYKNKHERREQIKEKLQENDIPIKVYNRGYYGEREDKFIMNMF
jgi:endonuclease IV